MMIGYLARVALLLGFVGLALPLPAAGADLSWGVNGHPLNSYPHVSMAQQLDLVRQLGLTSYRVNVTDMSQAGKLAELIREAKARQIEILPVVTPGINLDKSSAGEIYAHTYKLARNLIGRFKADIRTWELGNELEVYAILKPCEQMDNGSPYNCSWGPAGGVGPSEYFTPRWRKASAALKGLSDGTVDADPTIRKAMGTAGWGHVGAFDRMEQDGIRWDISIWHLYGDDPEWAFKLLARFDKPIWVTEVDNPYGSMNGEHQQADGLRHAIARLRHLAPQYRVEAAHIYELLDETYYAPDFEAFMGLVRLEKNAAGRWAPAGLKLAAQVVRDALSNPTRDAALGPEPLNKNGGLPERLQQRPAAAVKATPGATNGCDLHAIASRGSQVTDKIQYVYCMIVDRPVDGGGLQAWIAELGNGLPIADFLQGIIGSDEFARHARVDELSDSDFVALMYRVLLSREADGAGLASYTQGLDAKTLSRGDLVRGLILSNEFRARHPMLFN